MGEHLSERSRRKRDEILAAATELFLARGYVSTSMDDVAASARVSKQTVYKNFASKEQLFREIVIGSVTAVSDPFQPLVRELEEAEDLPGALRELARRYITAVLDREVLRRRLLVVREAGHLPDLAEAYHAGAPARTLEHLAETFGRLADRGRLAIDEPRVAAAHFAFLVLGEPLDRVLFRGPETDWSTADLTRMADAATEVFLAAYGPAAGTT